jgi:hypothetical protein
MNAFKVTRYVEYMMTEGDAVEYARLVGDVAALQRCLSKRPADGKALRHTMNAKVKQIAAIEARYA